MKKIIFTLVVCAGTILLNGCVEKSAKYQTMANRVDSLNAVAGAMNQEFDNILGEVNEVTQGLQRVREAHQILAVATQHEGPNKSRATNQIIQIKSDIQALSNTIEDYNKKLNTLETKNAKQSAQLRKMIAGLKEELEASKNQMEQLNNVLAQREEELRQKGTIIAQLTDNIENLNTLSADQKAQLETQDKALNQVNYLIGSTKELKNSGVITRRGLFAPPVVTAQAVQAGFTSADMREFPALSIDAKKVKILSVHTPESYKLSEDSNSLYSLEIINPQEFWKNTRYLVIQTN
ncbi:MAG: hypothetical protein ACRDDZ_10705 [Marinifilaceae bacterium]